MQDFSPFKDTTAIEVEAQYAQKARVILEKIGVWDRKRKLGKVTKTGLVAIPILSSKTAKELVAELQKKLTFSFDVIQCELPLSKVAKLKSPRQYLEVAVLDVLREKSISEEDIIDLMKELPYSWECHGDLVLFPKQVLVSSLWKALGNDIWPKVAQALSCRRLARKTDVISDDFRTPRVDLLLGSDGWVNHVDNGITYSYDITRCMFSAGNITEKMRIAELDCKDDVVVDLYAGIGYFTIPYLVHARAAHVHACEWNPNSVEALRKNLEQNGVASRATIYEGDNRKVCPKGIADRVNLGLIPTSELGWPVACAALKKITGGILHIHENVSSFKKRNHDSDHKESMCTSDNELTESVVEDKRTDLSSCLAPFGVMNSDTNSCDATPPCGNSAKHNIKQEWCVWSEYARCKINSLLQETWYNSWEVKILHIEHVKSYAPHVDHVVLDLFCKPIENS